MQEWDDPTGLYVKARTSGSTGAPKEILLRKADMIASARATCRFFGIDGDSFMVCPLSASYIAGKMMIVRAIVSGATLSLEPPSSNPLSDCDYPPIDLLPIVPTQVDAIVNQNHTIRNIIVGGAPLSLHQEHLLAGFPARVYATYGMTETCSHVALREIGSDAYSALPGISFGLDERGCLVIDLPEFSQKRIVTNDIVDLVDSTTFRWLGRADNVIITGGLKVHPEMIESKIARMIQSPFYITSQPDDKWGSTVVLVMEGGKMQDDGPLSDSFRELLPPHERPRKILHVGQIPRTMSGKLLRRLPSDH